jgi:transcriptional regulator with XRE-family HTH domain
MADKQKPRIRIADLRKERTSFTQEEFAQQLGKSVDTISNYERGKTGTELIQLIIKMCDLLKCRVDELIEYVEDDQLIEITDNPDISPIGSYDILRSWWQRVMPDSNTLGGKEIDGVIDILKSRSDFVSDNDIAKFFQPNNNLEELFKQIIYDYEYEQKNRYDTLDDEEKTTFQWDILSKDIDRCSCIFAYLKTKDENFLVNLNSKLKRLSKKNLLSS